MRTPAIVAAFRRIGLSEQAGTGVRAIFQGWQRLGHVPPVIEDDKPRRHSSFCCYARSWSAESNGCCRSNSA